MKYKILHIIPYFIPAWGYGGPVKIALRLAKKAVDKGHKVSVFTTNVSGEENKVIAPGEVNVDGIRVIRFANKSSWFTRQNILIPKGLSEVLKNEMKLYNLVCLHEYRTILNIKAAQIAKQNKIPYVLFAYGTIPKGDGWKKWVKLAFDRVWGQKILQNASCVFAQTKNERKEYLALGVSPEKIFSFPLMIDLEEFRHLPQKCMARSKFNLSSYDFLLAYLGRLHKYKGIDLILYAVGQLRKKIPSLKLLIVGRDEGYLSLIKEIIKKRNLNDYVVLSPPLYEKERLLVYCASDIFVLTPNFYEETSLAALEALACGTPVIITKQAEIPYLEDFGCGSIINYNLSELVDKIFRYYTNRDKSLLLSKKAKDLIKQKYNLDDLYNRFERIIIQLI